MRVFLARLRAFLGRFIRYSDKPLIGLCALTSLYGGALVYSAYHTAGASNRHFYVQALSAVVGLLFALIISQIDYSNICAFWPVYAVIVVAGVGLTLSPLGMMVPGTDQQAWIEIGFMTIQPAEMMKIAFIATFAYHLHTVREDMNRPLHVLLLCLHGALPMGLVFLQKDNGTALIFVFIFLTMLFCAGIKWIYVLLAGAVGAGVVPFLWARTSADKANRLLALLYPEQYLATEGWQQYLSLVAIGSGRMWGLGFTEGGGNNQLFARNNDFLFSVAGEEFGFVGSLVVIALLLGILLCILRTAFAARDRLGTYLCVGMAAYIGFQSILNIGMNVRLMPVVGVPLPFFSAGGSSALATYGGIGLVLSVCFSSRTKTVKTIFSRVR